MRIVLVTLVLALLLPTTQAAAAESADDLATFVVKSAGFEQGLCVNVDAADGRLTAALAKGSRLYVQGCTGDRASVPGRREAVVAADAADRASVIRREADFLPYADGIANLVVASRWGEGPITIGEVVRVLAPGATAILGNDGKPDAVAGIEADLKRAGVPRCEALPRAGWVRIVKPVDPRLGTWTHIKGGADQSYVSSDAVMAPWQEIRWIAGPRWGSLYVSYGALVTAGGRIYYKELRAADGGSQWRLVARDAYNGLQRWRVRSGPVERRVRGYTDYTLTCDEAQVYLVEGKTLVSRDGRTGTVTRTYAPGFTPRTVTCAGTALLASTRGRCAALDKAAGAVLWTRPSSAHPAAEGGTAYVVGTDDNLAAVEITTGKQQWKTAVPGLPAKRSGAFGHVVMHKAGVVYVVSTERYKPFGQVTAFDAKTGGLLWKRPGKFSHGVLPFESEVWCLSRDNKNKIDNMAALVLDRRTGDVKRQFQIKGSVMAKCWGARGTANYIMYSNGWYVDVSTGDSGGNPSTRSPCRLGQHPANGLTYFMPHHCDCKVTLRGFLGLSRAGLRPWFADADQNGNTRLFPADGKPADGQTGPDDWPIYRHDMKRSNATATAVPTGVTLLWSEKLGTHPLTQATAAYGLVYTAEPDSRRVFARDAATGKEKWSFVADGRVTYPPTLHQGLCLFGTGAGSVYCLAAQSGREVWRLRAAPVQKRIGVEGQFDSPWPVTGSVLVLKGVLHFSVGRSASQSGGLWLFGVDPATGAVKWRTRAGGSGDFFASDGDRLRHAGLFYSPDTGKRLSGSQKVTGLLHCTRYLNPVSVADYMATVEPNLSYKKHIELTDGRIKGDCLAFNEALSVAGWRYTPGVPGWKDKEKTNKYFLHAAGAATWNLHDIRQHVMGIVLTGDRAYVVGRPASYDPKDTAELWVVSTADGKRLQTVPLDGRPVYDGLSAAHNRLYLATTDGRLLCFGAR